MRRALIVASLAALTACVAACTALLDLKPATFDATTTGDGSTPGTDSASDGHDDGSTVNVDPDAGNPTACAAAFGMGNGVVSATGVSCGGGGSVQLTLSAANCGECNHDCGSAACVNGQCASATIATADTGEADPIVLATTTTNVAWTAALDGGSDTVVKVAGADGSNARTLSTIHGQWAMVGAFASDAVLVPLQAAETNAYPVNGGPWFKVGGNNSSKYIVSRGSDVFLEVFEDGLRRIKVEPEGAAEDLVTGQTAIRAIALGGAYLYWVNAAPKDDAGNDPRVARVQIDTPHLTETSDWQGRSFALAVDGAYVYVFDHVQQQVIRMPYNLKGPGEVISKWTGAPWDYATTMIADGDYVYVRVNKDGASGAILRVPRCGGAPLVLQTISALGRITISGDYVYWGDVLTKTIRRVRK